MLGDVGGAADLVLVASHEHAVLRRDEVRLDVVGALRDRELVGGQGVLGAVAGGTAVTDQDRLNRVEEALPGPCSEQVVTGQRTLGTQSPTRVSRTADSAASG